MYDCATRYIHIYILVSLHRTPPLRSSAFCATELSAAAACRESESHLCHSERLQYNYCTVYDASSHFFVESSLSLSLSLTHTHTLSLSLSLSSSRIFVFFQNSLAICAPLSSASRLSRCHLRFARAPLLGFGPVSFRFGPAGLLALCLCGRYFPRRMARLWRCRPAILILSCSHL